MTVGGANGRRSTAHLFVQSCFSGSSCRNVRRNASGCGNRNLLLTFAAGQQFADQLLQFRWVPGGTGRLCRPYPGGALQPQPFSVRGRRRDRKAPRLPIVAASPKYPGRAYIAEMPMVVATSSIALQKAIVKDYIPEISRALTQRGIITKPLT
ncbi:MAG: hypothetical protein CW346_13955 [Bacillaceae bacterium]|nr:hypothetical protein [Bacillaceae bacterium]OUM91277.1 MAG: hypothetical protein BAA03_02865 [Caldibacillus debilis]